MIKYRNIRTLARVKVENFLKTYNKGQYFGISFVKKNGEFRVLNARLGIKSGGNGRKTVGTADQPYLVVWSNNDQGYRAVNLETVSTITMGGDLYYVR